MTHEDVRSAGITRDQAQSLIGHLDAVAMQLERQVEALEDAASQPDCRTKPRLLADARMRREELSEARAHIDTLRTLAGDGAEPAPSAS